MAANPTPTVLGNIPTPLILNILREDNLNSTPPQLFRGAYGVWSISHLGCQCTGTWGTPYAHIETPLAKNKHGWIH